MAYVTEKRGVHYAVIHQGRNPVTGRERRRWHRCDDRADAERVARELGEEHDRRHRTGSSTTLGDFLLVTGCPTGRDRSAAPPTCPT